MNVGALSLLALVPALAAVMVSGPSGLAGYLLGAGGSALNLWAWWLLLGTVGRAFAEAKNPKGATSFIVLSFFLKAPLLVAVTFGAHRLGADASTWCLAGVALVYSFLVLWALGRS